MRRSLPGLNRRWIWGAVGAGAVLVTLTLLPWDQLLPTGEWRELLETQVTEATGLHTEIRALHIHPTLFTGIRVNLDDVVIRPASPDPKHRPQARLGVEEIRLAIPYWPLLSRLQPEIRQIDILHGMLSGRPEHLQALATNVVEHIEDRMKHQQKNFWSDKLPRILHHSTLNLQRLDWYVYREPVKPAGPAVLAAGPDYRIQLLRVQGIDSFESRRPLRIALQAANQGGQHLSGSVRFLPHEASLGKALQQMNAAITGPGMALKIDLSPLRKGLLSLPEKNPAAGRHQLRLDADTVELNKVQALYREFATLLSLPPSPVLDALAYQGTLSGKGLWQLSLTPTLHWYGGEGQLSLRGASVREQAHADWQIHKMNGDFRFSNQQVDIAGLKFLLDDTPLSLRGHIAADTRKLDLALTGKAIRLHSLQQSLSRLSRLFGAPVPTLERNQFTGTADANLHFSGNIESPQYAGLLTLHDVGAEMQDVNFPVHRINGEIAIADQIRLKDLTASLGESAFRIGGNISRNFGTFALTLVNPSLNLETFQREVLAHLPDAETTSLPGMTGLADVQLRLEKSNPDINATPDLSGQIHLSGFTLRPGPNADPLALDRLTLSFDHQRMVTTPFEAMVGKIKFTASGEIGDWRRAAETLAFSVQSDNIPTRYLREERPWLNTLLAGDPAIARLPEVWNTAGYFTVNASMKPATGSNTLTGEFGFHDVGLSWEGGDFPLSGLNGVLVFSQPIPRQAGEAFPAPRVESKNLRFRYGNSDFHPAVGLDQELTASISGILSPLTVNHFMTSPFATRAPYQSIPFTLTAGGRLAPVQAGAAPQWQTPLSGEMMLDLNDLWGKTVLAAKPPEAAGTASDQETQPIDQDAYLQASYQVDNQNLEINKANLHLFDAGDLWGSGMVSLTTEPPDISGRPVPDFQLYLITRPIIDLTQLASHLQNNDLSRAEGTLAMEGLMWGNWAEDKHMNGWMEFNGVKLPNLQIDNLTGQADFNDKKATYDFPSVSIPGVQVSLKADTLNAFAFPILMNNTQIRGAYFDVAGFQQFLTEVVDQKIQRQFLNHILPPRQEGDPVLPLRVEKGDLAVNEVIYQNILMENMHGKLSVYENSFFEIQDASLRVADGQVNGYFSLNTQYNNFMTVELLMKEVKANALTRALLNVSNQIFGDMDGTVRFVTQGMSDVESMNNANGTVTMKIRNGRLPGITKVETLLTAANVLRGGLLGLNLNNIIRTVAPFRSSYFADMSGDMLIARNRLYTDNLLSDGENLDLQMKGSVALDNGNVNMTVDGKMTQDVGGKLGLLGKLSLGKLVKTVPIVGYLPGVPGGVLSYVPGIGYTPGLGGPAGTYNRFRVSLNGRLEDPNAIQDFHWLKPTDQ
ncbi:MAG: AsmA-like C-terminal region-containing protein [Candidatus Melainabacteria bacterium]